MYTFCNVNHNFDNKYWYIKLDIVEQILFKFPVIMVVAPLQMDKQFCPSLYRACDYLSMLWLNLNYVNKRAPCGKIMHIE